MQFQFRDIGLIVGLSIAIVFMSYTFPALGLVEEDSATADDIPEFNITASQFDFTGDFPDRPGTPSQNRLVWDDEIGERGTENDVWLWGDRDSVGLQLVMSDLFNTHTGPGEPLTLRAMWFFDGVQQNTTDYNVTGRWENNNRVWVNKNSTGDDERIQFEILEHDLDDRTVVQYTIDQQPEDEGWIERIPIVGGVFSAGEQLASIVGWIGAVIWWGISWFFEIALNLLALLLKTVTFMVSLFHWLMSSYFGLVAGAPSAWSKVVVTIPGLILFLEFAKVTMIAISLLPTT